MRKELREKEERSLKKNLKEKRINSERLRDGTKRTFSNVHGERFYDLF